MKELLIFLLLLLFIENKQANYCNGGRIIAGFCKCPKNSINSKGICIKPIRCTGGNITGSSCICPKKTKLINGYCVPL